MKPIFALVDCNNFYASCERVFNPSLWNRPVAVLSNNDGCIVARSQEVKDLGIQLGTPLFQCRGLIDRHHVAVFSSNYALYGDMSSRVMETLAQFTPSLEVYSIDEAFLLLSGFERLGIEPYARTIKQTVERDTGIPVTVGVGESKVLAKVATRLAKGDPAFKGVCSLVGHPDLDGILGGIPVEKLWGVGRRYAKRLGALGITQARQLRDADDQWIRRQFTVVGQRIVRELRGESCLSLEEVSPPKKEICCSCSFGAPVTTLEAMREAACDYVAKAAEKLRRQRSAASQILVYITTNPFRDTPQYSKVVTLTLPSPTVDSLLMTRLVGEAVTQIFRVGYQYKKAGVVLAGIVPQGEAQLDLLWQSDSPKVAALMRCLDGLNQRHGSGTVGIGSAGIQKPWKMKQALKSPHYTTNWEDLPQAKASAV